MSDLSSPVTTSESTSETQRSRRRPAIVAGLLGTAALAFAMSGTLSAFTASITNDTNTGGVGSLIMRESGPDGTGNTVTCTTTATATSQTCSSINKYGGDLAMAPGDTSSTTITISNDGAVAATTFTLDPGTCTLTNPGGNSGDLCSVALVTVTQDGNATAITNLTPTQIAGGSYTLTPVAAGASSDLLITFTIPATAGDSVQDESLSQPLTWTFNA